ncbi:MAG: FMN-binding protein, partial [Clostridia bacterium]|nr:FMN-binding protein [Clostridia bacterium]
TCNGINDALKAAAPAVEAAPAEAVTYDVTGFQAMKVAIAVGADSKIVSVEVLEHNETPGFGADVIAKGFDALVGQDIATAKFDVVSGSTFTCNGINDALKAAAQAN